MLSHACLLPYTAGLAAAQGRGHALFFLQPASSSTNNPNDLNVQRMLKQQFRHQHWKGVDKQQVRNIARSQPLERVDSRDLILTSIAISCLFLFSLVPLSWLRNPAGTQGCDGGEWHTTHTR